MNKINKSKNVTSIAIKLNSIFVRKLFSKFLWIDIFLILFLIGYWCIDLEINFYGEFLLNAKRTFVFFPIESSTYTVVFDNGKTMIKDASSYLYIIQRVAQSIAIIEGIFLLKEIIFGTMKIRRTLKPLDEIAETASRLSNIAFDEEKFQNLEEAISKISPVISDERIYTGDSELHGLEEAINNLLERMRDSYKQQARFVSDASHELRTPISVIQGYANMLDRWGKNDESVLNESIEAIKTESENMKNLVEQLLFLARGINGKTQINPKEFLLNDMMNEVLEESKMIDEKHIYKYYSSEEIIVHGDIGLLKQAARILIENAAKYTEENEVIMLKTGINEKGEPYFSIQDNGIGMDEKDIPHIFERFFRADTARVRKNGGTGLGLSIAKWIVDGHKGYFSVLSRKGIGTRITIFLPGSSINF
ncbi:sensor histidine kinase [Clostridium beijerinckii]|jgi:Signal transduction histidine kinase|uniref:histidine kinase n=2 Tax=Clostridium beijerinckii TaxID=1520 RepID=A0AAE2RT88_CLOBE|nr:HAMP domain-containing sensor histidine kinase [Clostridium beijerinckii]ABR35686.1 histidine kinase [Clostridium beijerinckii NCIMB 8052]AIU01845.1 histidine kinase [Clostridium beijerinckii ATCC 35702]MBF7809676.1 HAMP domain-containing histidine kinase [Clostridium beijerinckii]NRT69549.1 signal transduction histidine kinase [Clostridium beijerinckii]NRT84304.1 signal transduction histidine kinase [Clostridium beijerinckii]